MSNILLLDSHTMRLTLSDVNFAPLIVSVLEATDERVSSPPAPSPEDPLERLELEDSQERVAALATGSEIAHREILHITMRELHAGETVTANKDLLWSWAQVFNGVYTQLRSLALNNEGVEITPGAPAEVNVEAEFAELLGYGTSEVDEGIDGQGWDEATALFAVLTSDALEILEELE
jgi:hypothetical protein